jgi:membrane protease subunit HflC
VIKYIGIALGAILAVILIAQAAGYGVMYTVDETEYVVITRFGEVQGAVTSPGLSFKSPIETVVKFDNRLLRIDVPQRTMPDKEKQNLEIDAYVRYKIVDPIRFIESLQDESSADVRIGNLAIGAIRDQVGLRDREDIIGGNKAFLADGTVIVAPRLTEDGTPSRQAMMQTVLANLKESAQQSFGVEIVDVRIKRADFTSTIESDVFNQMRTERSVLAQKLRAEGEEEYLTKTADVDRQVSIIQAEADRDANVLRGEGEASAISILAEALAMDPEFYAFRRSLEAYSNFLKTGTTIVLSSESDLFRYLESPNEP